MFKKLLSDKLNAISFWSSLFFFALSLIIVLINFTRFPPFLPLYNKLPWGYARLGHSYEIAIPIGIPIVFTILNIILSQYIYEKSPLLVRFIFLIILLSSLFTCIFVLKLILNIL